MAAIYARVSSEQQREENTIASQTAALTEFAQSHDLEVPKDWVFEDEGYSEPRLSVQGWSAFGTSRPKGRFRLCSHTRPTV
jgi:Resolvase, N terminal domain